MENHVKILAILYIALSAMGLVAAVVLMFLTGGLTGLLATVAQEEPDAAAAVPIIGIVFGIITVIVVVLSIPGIIAGLGLLGHKEWARILTLVLSAINILNVPFGTILGAYGLWVLLSNDTLRLFEARRAQAMGGIR